MSNDLHLHEQRRPGPLAFNVRQLVPPTAGLGVTGSAHPERQGL